MKKLLILLALVVVAAFLATAIMAQDKPAEKPKAAYVGVNACKMCHKPQFDAWSATPHAKAFAALKPEEQKKAECNVCHQTGKTAADSMIVNVTCEACHGAGSEYKKTMMAKAKWTADKAGQLKIAEAAGLVIPTAETCTTCHKKEGNPNYKEFTFDTMKGKVHPIAAAEPAKK